MIQELNKPVQKIPWRVINNSNIGDNYGPGETVRVRCIDPRGIYYNFARRREGDVFDLIPMYVTVVDEATGKPKLENGQVVKVLKTAEQQFSQQTMELVDDSTPERTTTAQQALNKVQDELNEAKIPAKRR